MNTRLAAMLAFALAAPAFADYPRAGWQAVLCTMKHDVSGTVTILDEDTVRVEYLTFDGGGMSVFFVLGAEDSDDAYKVGLPIGDDMHGTVYNGDTWFEIDLPPGKNLDGFNAIAVWCVPSEMNFGCGPFLEPCYGDFNGDGVLDLFDFLMFIEAFNAHVPRADCDTNGLFDIFDFLCFFNEFGEGCP